MTNAQELASNTAAVFSGGDFPDKYLYSNRPVREEIIEEFGEGQSVYAVITRNAYGSLVLNTARVLFADIDNPKEEAPPNPIKPLLGLLGKFFGSSNLPSELLPDELLGEAPDDVPTRVAEYVRNSPGLGLRLYRTAAGFRCLITSREYDPLSEESKQLLSDISSDPLYVKLCQVQECFRARLTPKFWRCGAQGPTVRFPWANASQEQSMRDWEQVYRRCIEGYATCELLESLGTQEMHPQIAPIVELHDRLCCQAGRPLA